MCKIPEDDGNKYSVATLRATLLNEEENISKRTRCVFLLRQLGSNEAIDALVDSLRSSSVLLGHEVAFVLGQMRNAYVLPELKRVLADESYHPVVRHEAAEAIGAIGDVDALDLLTKYCGEDVCVEVRDTCLIAVERIKFIKENPTWDDTYKSGYNTIDPAPPAEESDITELTKMLCDENLSLYTRYRAMFKLRDINSEESTLALAKGFNDASPVLRHEIAYVFGMTQHPAAAPSLIEVINNRAEHSMVRHEAAEALGSLAEDDESIMDVLKKIQNTEGEDRIVTESCDVALDIADYWIDQEQFETAV